MGKRIEQIVAYHITITGIVQGVGFRPFVYNLAQRMSLRGWVLNHSGGVDIEVEGDAPVLEAFIAALQAEAPPLAHIVALDAQPIVPNGHKGFEIRHSERQEGQYQLISPDVATCHDCQRELFDSHDRRYRYPFINCTNCGPRFTIIEDIPYDRPNTTMRVFPLCEDCRAEYEDPTNRRFHAQPNACPVCGPQIWLVEKQAVNAHKTELPPDASTESALAQAKALLLSGKILAIKGLGGFHLACDATNVEAVHTLRQRKHRPHKPLAIMAPSLDVIKALCEVSPEEQALLTSSKAPIVLLNRRLEKPSESGELPASVSEIHVVDAVAPHQHTLGVMLPYTPLHHILLHDVGRPLVMTSGNVTEEPIAKDNAEALRRLLLLADAFLLHNRDIYARYDDSVVQVVNLAHNKASAQAAPLVSMLRRARGYAPFPVRLPFNMKPTLAVGPLLKNTFTLTRDAFAFVSQHIGDMENLETLEHYEAALETYKHLFRLEPEIVVSDLHPDYLTTRLATQYAADHGLAEPLRVQHHKAHIAACLADNARPLEAGPVIGVALDGTGYGEDGAIWGGEWFVGNYDGYARVAHLEYLPLPGGDAATREPWRITVAYLYALLGESCFPAGMFCPSDAMLVRQQVQHRLNTPLTSSMGRLFDAVSALLGVREKISYEAQAAIELEQVAAWGKMPPSPYDFDVVSDDTGLVVQLAPLFDALLSDVEGDVARADIALRFHTTVAHMVCQVCERISDETDVHTVALSGGVFQNRLLLELVVPQLRKIGFEVLLHHQVPCNDGGVSLGQAALAHFG